MKYSQEYNDLLLKSFIRESFNNLKDDTHKKYYFLIESIVEDAVINYQSKLIKEFYSLKNLNLINEENVNQSSVTNIQDLNKHTGVKFKNVNGFLNKLKNKKGMMAATALLFVVCKLAPTISQGYDAIKDVMGADAPTQVEMTQLAKDNPRLMGEVEKGLKNTFNIGPEDPDGPTTDSTFGATNFFGGDNWTSSSPVVKAVQKAVKAKSKDIKKLKSTKRKAKRQAKSLEKAGKKHKQNVQKKLKQTGPQNSDGDLEKSHQDMEEKLKDRMKNLKGDKSGSKDYQIYKERASNLKNLIKLSKMSNKSNNKFFGEEYQKYEQTKAEQSKIIKFIQENPEQVKKILMYAFNADIAQKIKNSGLSEKQLKKLNMGLELESSDSDHFQKVTQSGSKLANIIESLLSFKNIFDSQMTSGIEIPDVTGMTADQAEAKVLSSGGANVFNKGGDVSMEFHVLLNNVVTGKTTVDELKSSFGNQIRSLLSDCTLEQESGQAMEDNL